MKVAGIESDLENAPGVTRTRGPRIRNPVLYPPELRGHNVKIYHNSVSLQYCPQFPRQAYLAGSFGKVRASSSICYLLQADSASTRAIMPHAENLCRFTIDCACDYQGIVALKFSYGSPRIVVHYSVTTPGVVPPVF